MREKRAGTFIRGEIHLFQDMACSRVVLEESVVWVNTIAACTYQLGLVDNGVFSSVVVVGLEYFASSTSVVLWRRCCRVPLFRSKSMHLLPSRICRRF